MKYVLWLLLLVFRGYGVINRTKLTPLRESQEMVFPPKSKVSQIPLAMSVEKSEAQTELEDLRPQHCQYRIESLFKTMHSVADWQMVCSIIQLTIMGKENIYYKKFLTTKNYKDRNSKIQLFEALLQPLLKVEKGCVLDVYTKAFNNILPEQKYIPELTGAYYNVLVRPEVLARRVSFAQ